MVVGDGWTIRRGDRFVGALVEDPPPTRAMKNVNHTVTPGLRTFIAQEPHPDIAYYHKIRSELRYLWRR